MQRSTYTEVRDDTTDNRNIEETFMNRVQRRRRERNNGAFNYAEETCRFRDEHLL